MPPLYARCVRAASRRGPPVRGGRLRDRTRGLRRTAALAKPAPGGQLVWFGQASREPVTLDFFDFCRGPAQGRITHFDYTRSDAAYGQDLAALVRLVAGGRLHPEIGVVADWSRTADVIGDVRARKVRGNAVLTVG
ncbi:hypothetical protein [Streptomyces sp. NPDC049040]|uniref:hypothetical protein n=1 Tax=Streptomyces sp. NPDC049040 TaxID=3365593 RepID=UPI00371D4794